MKLLVVSHPCATPVNQQFYAELQRLTAWDVSIVVPSNWHDEYGSTIGGERWPTFTGTLIPVPVRQSGNIVLHTYRTSFTKLTRELRPDAVYVHHEPYAAATAQVYWGCQRAGIRGPIGFYTAQNIRKRYPPPFRWTEAWVLRTSAFACPVSATVADVVRSKGYAADLAVLPLGIDPDVYRSHSEDHVAAAASDDSAAPVIGYLGRLVPEKGLRTLWSALARITDLSWTMAVVGAGPLDAELRATAAAAGLAERVRFYGFVPHDQASRYLSTMDLLVLPSETQRNWREQFGRVILEAMACGTPVLGSDSGEIPVLIRDTRGGLVFRERDVDSLAAALRQLLTDSSRRRALAAAGAAAVADRYTLAATAGRFADLVRAAVGLAVTAPFQSAGPTPRTTAFVSNPLRHD